VRSLLTALQWTAEQAPERRIDALSCASNPNPFGGARQPHGARLQEARDQVAVQPALVAGDAVGVARDQQVVPAGLERVAEEQALVRLRERAPPSARPALAR